MAWQKRETYGRKDTGYQLTNDRTLSLLCGKHHKPEQILVVEKIARASKEHLDSENSIIGCKDFFSECLWKTSQQKMNAALTFEQMDP